MAVSETKGEGEDEGQSQGKVPSSVGGLGQQGNTQDQGGMSGADPTGQGAPTYGEYSPADAIAEWLRAMFGGPAAGVGDMPMEGLGAKADRTSPITTSKTAKTLNDVMDQVRGLNEAQMSRLQRRLFQAGFYSGSAYTNAASISWGSLDNLTLNAMQNAFQGAALNEVDNFDRFLEDRAAQFLSSGVTANGDDVAAATGGGSREIDVFLDDPDGIRLDAEEIAKTLLGRKPTEAELSAVTEAVWAKRRAAARGQAAAEAGTSSAAVSATGAMLAGQPNFAGPQYDPKAGTIDKLDPDQVAVATTIIKVGQDMGLSEEYIVGALSAGMVESGLRNLPHLGAKNDHDSIGVFQQRVKYYGPAEKIMDVSWAARKFYEKMLASRGETLGEWVANTQRPAKQYRGRYAERMNDAAQLFSRISGGDNVSLGGGTGMFQDPATVARRAGSSIRPTFGQADPFAGGNPYRGRGASGKSSLGPVDPIPRDEEAEGLPFWIDSMLGGNSMQDPVYREQFTVDPQATIEMKLRELDPVGYESKRAQEQAFSFFQMLDAGGGLV